MIADIIAISLAFAALYLVIELRKLHESNERRIKALEARKPEPEKRVPVPAQPKQIFEKPIVKNAKEVKPLEIGDGRMRFDEQNQVAEWV